MRTSIGIPWAGDDDRTVPVVNTVRDLIGRQSVGSQGWIAVAWCLGILDLAITTDC